MEKHIMFQVLGIQETRDEKKIREAYRNQLITVNPEENPEGFKRLRKAYEQALAYCREKVQEEVLGEEIAAFLSRVDAVYRQISLRLDEKQWKALLEDPVLDDLGDGEEVKRRLFKYLMSHYRLPDVIWSLISDHFCIPENRKEFVEFLPENFVNFILRYGEKKENEDTFDYEALSGSEEADYDGFLSALDNLMDFVRLPPEEVQKEDWRREFGKRLEAMEVFGITHPWYELEKVSYTLELGEQEKAEQMLRKLWAEAQKEDHLLMRGAQILKACGKKEEAEEIFQEFAQREEKSGHVYLARYELAEMMLERGELEQAREFAQKACKLHATDAATKLLDTCCGRLIQKYTSCPAETLTMEEILCLGWCYLQTKRKEEGRAYFTEHSDLMEDSARCHKLKAMLWQDQQETALTEVRLWREHLLREEEHDTEEISKSWETEGIILLKHWDHLQKQNRENAKVQEHQNTVSEEEGEEQEEKGREEKDQEEKKQEEAEVLQGAEAALKEALKLDPESLSVLMCFVSLDRKKKDYESMEKHCRQMIQKDPGFYWAYDFMQEAFDERGMAQEVIDTFYEAKRIYGGYPEIYERTVRVFKYYQMGRDIDYILGQAREAGVDSPYLMVCRLERMEENAGTKEECAKAEQYGKEVICCLEERMSEMEVVNEELPPLWKSIPGLLASAYMEMAYIYEKKKKTSLEGIPTGQRWVERAQKQWHDSMERYMKQAIKLEPDHLWNRYYLGRFYILHKKNYQAGYEHLKQCEERGMEFEWMYFYLARYHEMKSNREEAIRYYIKAHEKAPGNKDFAWRVAWIYRRNFEETEQKEYYELALKYLDIQTDSFGADAEDHWQYFRLYARAGRKEEAFREIDLALSDDPSSLHLADKAFLLKSTGRYQEALEYYIQAVRKKRKEGAEYEYAHEQVKDMFSNLGRYQEGADWFEKEMEQLLTEDQRNKNLQHIADLYYDAEEWEKILETLDRIWPNRKLTEYACDSWSDEGKRIRNLLKVYQRSLPPELLAQRVEEAVRLLEDPEEKKLRKSNAGKFKAWYEIAAIYNNYLMDDQRGLACLEKCLPYAEDDWVKNEEHQDVLVDLMCCLWRLGRAEEGKKYQELFLEIQKEEVRYDICQELGLDIETLCASSCMRAKYNCYQLFMIHFFCGEYETARTYAKKMEEAAWCYHCGKTECPKQWMVRGYLALHDNNYGEAEACFEKVVSLCFRYPDDAMAELLRLQRRKQEV